MMDYEMEESKDEDLSAVCPYCKQRISYQDEQSKNVDMFI
jgi:hypothetical protein